MNEFHKQDMVSKRWQTYKKEYILNDFVFIISSNRQSKLMALEVRRAVPLWEQWMKEAQRGFWDIGNVVS